MAYSRTPETSSHQSARLPVAGSMTLPAYLQTGTGMKYYNCMPRTIKQNGGDPVHILERRASYSIPFGLPVSNFFRGAYTTIGQTFIQSFVALGTNIYIVGDVSPKIALATTYTDVRFAEVRSAANHYIVALESHSSNARIHIYDLVSTSTSTIALNVGAQGEPVFLNGRLYVAGWNNQRIYNSAVGDITSWSPSNDFIDAEQIGDRIVGLGLHRNHLVVLGSHSIEFFSDVGYEIGSPLLRQETYSSLIGSSLPATNSTASVFSYVGNDLYFYGSISGAGAICRIRDFKVTKISDDYVDRLLNDLSLNVDSRSMFTVQSYGRSFVIFTLPTEVLAFCVEEGIWAIWSLPENFMPVMSTSYKTVNAAPYYSVLWGYDFVTGNGRVQHLRNINSAGLAIESFSAYMIFDTFDGGTEFQKHFKFVDVVGDLGDNLVTLSFTKESSKESTSFTATNDSAGLPIRFRNLCRAKRINFKITFTGTTQIEFRGLDVYYNLGTN